MTLADAAESNTHTLTVAGKAVQFGKLTMRDFATLQSKAGMLTYNAMLDWCQTPAGCLATVEMAIAKVDPIANADSVDALGTPTQIAEAAIDILNISNGIGDEQDAEGNAESGPSQTG